MKLPSQICAYRLADTLSFVHNNYQYKNVIFLINSNTFSVHVPSSYLPCLTILSHSDTFSFFLSFFSCTFCILNGFPSLLEIWPFQSFLSLILHPFFSYFHLVSFSFLSLFLPIIIPFHFHLSPHFQNVLFNYCILLSP